MNNRTAVCLAAVCMVSAVCAILAVRSWTAASDGAERAAEGGRADPAASAGAASGGDAGAGGPEAENPEPPASGRKTEEAISEDERRERAEEALVDAFDALTDRWMEPADDGVSMEDVDEFSAQFRKVPDAQKEDCLRRALNLVPDENVMLLAGILMDKSQSEDLIELVYNDVLNRDEDVKKPILQQIFKDRTHPCWTDTAWILDVTGELSGEK